MTTRNEALKTRLMAEAEEAIDKLVGQSSRKEELDLSDIEQYVRTAGQTMMEQFTQELVQEEGQRKDDRVCPECGQKMRAKGRKTRHLVTETGDVCLDRVYYYCPSCRKGFFPPRPTVEVE